MALFDDHETGNFGRQQSIRNVALIPLSQLPLRGKVMMHMAVLGSH